MIPFFVEYLPQFLKFGPSSHTVWQEFQSPSLYQWLVTLGPRKPRSHFVRLVIFRHGSAPDDTLDEHNLCPQRAFTAKMICIMARSNPAAIVIDKRYPVSTVCKSTETKEILEAADRISATVPIIVGYGAKGATEVKNENSAVIAKLSKNQALVAFPTLQFGPGVTHGALRPDSDNRRLPLDWPIYPSIDAVLHGSPTREPSLALAAAQAYDPAALEEPRIKKLRARPEFPFTSFLTENELGSYSPLSMVCADDKSNDWKNCAEPPLNPLIRNRIVVIGQDAGSDYHQTPIGDVPGVVLQANYIESILDDRYLYPVSWILDLFFSLLWVAAIEYIFDKLPFSVALLLAGLFTGVGGLILYDLCVVQFGCYVLLLPPSLLVIALNVLSRWRHSPHSPGTGTPPAPSR